MQPFEYTAPGTVDEALAMLRQHGVEAKILAGGQSLVPLLNYRLAKPRIVIDINRLPIDGVAVSDGWLKLGALVRHHVLEESREVARYCPVLSEAAALIGNVRVRSLGSVGGSLVHADPAAELPMVMVALGARMTVSQVGGSRRLQAGEFFTGYLSTALTPDELLVEVEVPELRGMGFAIEEFTRRAGDFAIVAVTALVSLDGRGRVDDARLAYAGLGSRPVRARHAEDLLRGHEPTTERVAAAARGARESLSPESDAFVSAAYRLLLVEVLTRRALGRAVSGALQAGAPRDGERRA